LFEATPARLFITGATLLCALESDLTGELPERPEVSPFELMVRTPARDALCAGAVLASTERFCTLVGGCAACEFTLAAPSELCEVGFRPTEFDTFMSFKFA